MSNIVIPSKLIDAEQSGFGEIVIHHERQFFIPFNQRPWSWNDARLFELWNDILFTVDIFYENKYGSNELVIRSKPNGLPHFFGAFVFVQNDSEEESNILSVVDGQQRLTAISMYVSAILSHLYKLQLSSPDPHLAPLIDNLIDQYRRILIVDHPSDLKPRLIVDSEYQALFEACVIIPKNKENREKLINDLGLDFKENHIHKKIVSSYEHSLEKVDEYLKLGTHVDIYKKALALYYIITKAFRCISVIVSEETYSFKVFECLNAKGQPLSEYDKIKNIIFNSAPISDHKYIKKKLDAISYKVPKGDMASFVRFRHIAFIGPCQKTDMYRVIKNDEINKSSHIDMKALVDKWSKDAEWLARVTFKTKYSFNKETEKLLKDFQTLNITYGIPFLIAAASKYLTIKDDISFQKAVNFALNFSFRTITICNNDTPFLEDNLGYCARKLSSGEWNLSEISSHLRRKNPDAEFVDKFKKTSENRAKIQYYIFYEIEKSLSGASGLVPAPHSPSQNIEHILPRTLSKASARKSEWLWARSDPEKHALYVNRLGNICILEGDINKHVNNYDFNAKQQGKYPPKAVHVSGGAARKFYKDSKLNLVKDLTDTSKYPGWSFEIIEKRQENLAILAKKIWSLYVT